MALEKLLALEVRIKGLVNLVQELKTANLTLARDLRAARETIGKHEELVRRLEEERAAVRARLEKVVGDLELLESLDVMGELADELKEVEVD
jgi:uncharacterized protein (DUF3084 family)